MRQLLTIIFTLITISSFAQKLEITTLDKLPITVTLLDSNEKTNTLKQYKGEQDNSIRKKWTARTYRLSDGKILIEFYDKQAVLVENLEHFNRLHRVRFVKNTIDFLKKNVSYKIELSFDEGKQIIEKESPKRLTQYTSDLPQWYDFEVYQLNTAQILLLDKSKNFQAAAIFPDIKTLASEKTSVLEEAYGSDDEEYLMKVIASGDRLVDYEHDFHLIYPKYMKDIIKHHRLSLTERKVYVSNFFGNLYESEKGYYILIDEEKQKNGAGNKMSILSLRIYDNLEQVKDAEKKYRELMDKPITHEHFYQKTSDKYGQNFSGFVPQLIEQLPSLINFDKEQLSFDSTGMDLVDEALKWNGTNYNLFDSLFPSVLAYYGKCYIEAYKDGVWTTTYFPEDKVWIPELKLTDGTSAWNWRHFYKQLYEGPVPMRWIGDWNRQRKNREKN